MTDQHLPSVRLPFPALRRIVASTQTALLVPHGAAGWAAWMPVGREFEVWANHNRPQSGHKRKATTRHWARLRVGTRCVHDGLNSVRTCHADHRFARFAAGDGGWNAVFGAAVQVGERPGPVPKAVRREKSSGPWTLFDFRLVASGQSGLERRDAYRNAIEAALAEDGRYYEFLRLSAAKIGEERVVSDDEYWYRARSSVYSRKLAAIEAAGGDVAGGDVAAITVNDAEVQEAYEQAQAALARRGR